VSLLVYAVLGGAAYWWLFMRATFEEGGAIRFRDHERLKILEALGSTVAVPAGQVGGAARFQIARFDPTSVSGRQAVETARAASLPVGISEHFLDVIADPNDNRPTFLFVIKRGSEAQVCAPGSGNALIVD